MSYAAFGSYQLDAFSNGVGNIFRSKPVGAPTVSPVTSNVARRYGAVKNGESVPPKDMDVVIKIVGSSRSDLTVRLDALKKALRLRGQQLVLYEDLRYFSPVDCVAADGQLVAGGANIASCVVTLKFRVYDPVAYAAASSLYDTGTVILTSASGVWNFPSISIAGGGTSETYPLIRLINQTSTGSTTLTTACNSGTAYTTLSVNATSFSGVTGDKVLLTSGGNSQLVTVSSNFSVGATTINVTSFVANATYGVGSGAAKATQWDAISITQATDSQTITTYSTATVPLPGVNAQYVDIQCDPATGFYIMSNGNGKLHDPVGVFPVLEPDSTTFNIAITSSSAVSAQAIFSWSARYL
jgi:hypothetical protein